MGIILDVVLSDSTPSDPVSNPIRKPISKPITNPISNPVIPTSGHSGLLSIGGPTSDPTRSTTDSRANETAAAENQHATALDAGKQITLLHSNTLGSAFEQRLVSLLPPNLQTQVLSSSDVQGSIVQAIQDGKVERLHDQLLACWQDLKDEMAKNSELMSTIKDLVLKNNALVSNVAELALKNNELAASNMESTTLVIKLQESFNVKQEDMKQLQAQALDQLSLLHNRVQALMSQTYELH
ncbi:hypothetical protein BGX31_011533 [Mortierella sp. GBA43]|nr:hypothetical protein BGX31_011533 [Mortierella sp. GBA43]